jgi:hypothetical protein
MNNFLGHKGVPLPQMKSALRSLAILPERWSCHLPPCVGALTTPICRAISVPFSMDILSSIIKNVVVEISEDGLVVDVTQSSIAKATMCSESVDNRWLSTCGEGEKGAS